MVLSYKIYEPCKLFTVYTEQTSSMLQAGYPTVTTPSDGVRLVCLFVWGFYGPVNNEVMSSRPSVNSGSVPGQA